MHRIEMSPPCPKTFSDPDGDGDGDGDNETSKMAFTATSLCSTPSIIRHSSFDIESLT